MKSPHTGIKRVFYAMGYSMKGFKSTWIHEAAFRQEAMLVLFLMPVAFWLGDSLAEQLILIAVWLFVLVIEIINSAIESVVDRIGSEFHDLSGRAKDQGSAAVLLSIVIATLVWVGFLVTKLSS